MHSMNQRAVGSRGRSLQARVISKKPCVTCNALNTKEKVGLGAAAVVLSQALMMGRLIDVAQAVTSQQLFFLEAWRAVDRAYVDKSFNGQSWFKMREEYVKKEPMKNKAETYGTIRKLLATLDDPFTRFLEPERLAALRRGTTGSVTGIGVEITYDATSNELVVVAPAPGGPAEMAGVKAGDYITGVDGTPTAGLSLYEASDLLLGEVGTEVTLSVRSASGATTDLPLTRKKLEVKSVSHGLCMNVPPSVGPSDEPDSLGYIRVASFTKQTTIAFREALVELKAQTPAGIVIDLRNNGGGYFPAGVEMARSLIASGDIVLIADSDGIRDIYSADTSTLDAKIPIAVLVNKGTASASEVMAGALKDSRGSNTTIVGTNTFGKGLIQTIVNLSDGSGVAVTVARYQTPLGIDINKIGISPDITADLDVLPLVSAPDVMCKALQAPTAPRLFK